MKKMYVFAAGAVVAVGLAAAYVAYGYAAKDPDHIAVLKLALVEPESAKFRYARTSKERNTIWCGEVNSRNRMGGYAGFTKYIVMLPDEAYGVLAENIALEGGVGFDESWKVWCH